jgi:hypothetical protein
MAAYVSEAQLYDNRTLSALTETLDDVRAAIETGGVLIARRGPRIVGAVRGEIVDDTCHIGRVVVAPDMQGRRAGHWMVIGLHRTVDFGTIFRGS